MSDGGTIRAGIGGWNFKPWEGSFYPDKLAKTKQLHYASRQLSTIEINGTYYRGQTPQTFAKWAADVPDGFVFSVKGNRFVTNKKKLAEAAESMKKFFDSGVSELGESLGPIIWQFAPTKKFDPDDFEAFLKLLPETDGGLRLRHVLEVRNPTFVVPEFPALVRKYQMAICYAHHHTYPQIADITADFVYARLQKGEDSIPTAYEPVDLDGWAGRARAWSRGGSLDDLPLADPATIPEVQPRDVFVYFIHEGKVRAPQAAQSFMQRVSL